MNKTLLLEAFQELSRRKLRTGLTLLGMVFGVAAIVAMLAVGEGSKQEALKLIAELGLNNVLIEAKEFDEKHLKENRKSSLGLSIADGEAILQIVPGAKTMATRKEVAVDEVVAMGSSHTARVFGVSTNYLELTGQSMAQGRWMNELDIQSSSPVCVLGPRIANTLFGSQNPIGQLIKVDHVWLEVIGVIKNRASSKSDFEGVKLGLDEERIFIPWHTANRRFNFSVLSDEVDTLMIALHDKQTPSEAALVIQKLIDQRHGGVSDTNLVVPMNLYRQNQQTQRIFTIVMSSIAAVSLIVGGIGIMNIMLANVLERKREIGLKRALGARRKDVVQQFLAEALVIATVGALLGVILGVIAAYSIAALAQWAVAWSLPILLIAVLICVLVGVAFGVVPAKQAALLDPIGALRSD